MFGVPDTMSYTNQFVPNVKEITILYRTMTVIRCLFQGLYNVQIFDNIVIEFKKNKWIWLYFVCVMMFIFIFGFLQALQKLLEMGFSEQESIDALKVARNDQDAAVSIVLIMKRFSFTLVFTSRSEM